MAQTYDIGDQVRVSATFTTTLTGDALDPSVVSLMVREPTGNRTTYVFGTDAEVVKDSTGVYHCDLSPTVEGTHWYRWWSTGTGQAAAESRFNVRPLEVQR